MKSFYSIIRYVNNSVTNENLAIGIIMISGNTLRYRFSKEKIALTSKLNNKNSKLLEYAIENIRFGIDQDIKNSKYLFETEHHYSVDFLNKISIYSNNFLQFDPPKGIDMDFDEQSFAGFFERFIDVAGKARQVNREDRSFVRKVNARFIHPLRNIIDTHYKVKKGTLPKLFFDYTLDGIGVNGVIYSVKSVDINSDKAIDSLRKEISDLESLNFRLDRFAEDRDIDADKNEHYLVVDPYIGDKHSHHDLYNLLMENGNDDFPYKIIDTSQLPKVVEKIEKAKAQKFSTLF
ncbi:hypothetical protein EG338_06210 [Kaistella haifensis]|nr:hypothetical protein EG338_06210 [Kaistella haifensis]